LLLKGLDNANGINVDSIEILLSNMTDLHNTIGKSYEFLVDVISGLMKNVNTNKTDESSTKKMKEYSAHIDELKGRIRDLENELQLSRAQIRELEHENQLKDSTLQDIRGQLNIITERVVPVSVPQKSDSSNKTSAPRKLEDLLPSPSPPIDFSFLKQSLEREQPQPQPKIEVKEPDIFDEDEGSKLKRKYDEFSKPSMHLMNIEEDGENSRSSSTTQNKKEGSDGNGFDDFKFKKVFKKVKRTENSKTQGNSANSTSTPQLITYNGKNKTEVPAPKPSQLLSFDEDNSLHNLLNNFIDNKENSKSNKVFNKSELGKKNELSPRSSRNDDQKLEPKSPRASLSEPETYETNNSKLLKKGQGQDMFSFSQKSPLKSFDLPVDTTNIRSIPITRNGRVSIKSDTNVNLMQKMLNSHQKRTSTDMFRMSTQSNSSVDKKKSSEKNNDILKPISDEDLVRAPYRTKAERENLQGFDCDQCKKFYDFIADGIHIKSAADYCNNCSRHRDKFPLPATPEVSFFSRISRFDSSL